MTSPARMLLLMLPFLTLPASLVRAQTASSFRTSKEHRKVVVETFGTDASLPALILLHGSDGPSVQYFYDRAQVFAASGYQVLYPHYYDAAPTRSQDESSFDDWIGAVRDMVEAINPPAVSNPRKIFLLGFSQGSEIALAAGAEGLKVNGIADWYGALFDSYARTLRTLPPLLILHGARDTTIPPAYAQQITGLCETRHLSCEIHIYPGQGHGFNGADLADADRRTLAFFHTLAQPASQPE